MTVDDKIERIVRLYPDECRPKSLEPVLSGEGFSGAKLWRVQSDRGPLCLRRWPAEHPTQERLEFIQAVLWHVDQEGFHLIPVPLETRHRHGYVWHAGHLWELTPWLPGNADYRDNPTPAKLSNALGALAHFHQAAATFPLPDVAPVVSPGMVERRDRLRELLGGRLADLRSAITDALWPELAARGHDLIALVARIAPKIQPLVESAAAIKAVLQPCIRDIWHAHVLFVGQRLSGIVDFGSLRTETVAADVARLVGSLAGDDPRDWQRGLSAYQALRPLGGDELTLVSAFDRAGVLFGGLQWLEWVYLQQRVFANQAAVLARVDEFLSRLQVLWATLE